VRILLVACISTMLGGCSVAGPRSEPAGASAVASMTPAAPESAGLSPGLSPAEQATAAATAAATLSAEPASEAPISPDATLTPPPDGLLAVDGGDAVIGELGSWGWLNAGSDAPWLPGYPIHIGAGEPLTFRMAQPVGIESWRVSRVPPSSIPGSDG